MQSIKTISLVDMQINPNRFLSAGNKVILSVPFRSERVVELTHRVSDLADRT